MSKSLASRPTPALCINSRSLSFHHSLTGLPLKQAARVHEECGVTPLQLVVNAGKSSNNRILERRKKPSSKPYVSGKVKKVIDVKLGDGGGYNVEDPFAGAMTVIALEPKEEEYSSEVSSRLRNVVGRQAVISEQSVPKTSKILGQDFEDEVIEVRIPSKLVQDQDSNKDRDRKDVLQATQLVEETASAKSTGDDFMTLYSCSGGENVDDSFTTQARESDENEENEDTDSILELYDRAQDLHRERNEVNDDAIASTNFHRESQNSEANESGRYRTDGEEDGEEMVSTWEQGPGVSTEFSDLEDYLNELTEKEKRGVPAVMRCFDRAKIYVKAGDGGNGVVAFRREKYVPFGGPSGGSGGIGGNVYIEADAGMTSLLPFRRNVHFRAGRGNHGKGSSREGAMGTDCLVKVPVGTIIRAAGGQEVGGQEGEVLLEMTTSGQVELLLPGGRGGRGNTAFKTGRNKAPQLAEYGEIGPELWIQLELKLVADVGIVGVPNAGKSTLLSAISAAKPEIANYPFTTLLPNLGVVPLTFDVSMVVADLPGLMEGAHQGIGLGHEFLRHTERCSVLVQVVDGTCEQAVQEYEAVRLELELFNPALAEKPYVVAYNKMDIQEAADRWPSFQDTLQLQGVQSFCMSAATQQGTMPVVWAAYELLQNQKKRVLYEGEGNPGETLEVGEVVKKIRDAPIEEFTVTCDKHTRTWEVTGAGLERFTQMTNWEYFEAVRRFQHVLDASGVNRRLREEGVREGDTVIVGQMEFQWKDSDDLANLGDWKRGSRGTKVWPH